LDDARSKLQGSTDYRLVPREILSKRMANPKLEYNFPGYKDCKPLNFPNGNALPIEYNPAK